ncbi:MAG TPA: site-specific integrase [Pyrinomonadaceae bacterium]|jgi:Site-specific recombinase XerD|nr:site-specific integrase [Pyrinomonadaceae bacterium]
MRERKHSASVTKTKDGKWLARLQYYKVDGERRSATKVADTKTEAQELLEQLKAKHQAGVIHARQKTFHDLVEELKTSKYAPAKYSESGKKLSGVRDPRKQLSLIKHLDSFFGEKRLSSITLKDLEAYKAKRLESVGIATSNRELQLMRAMLNAAVRYRYLDKSPFMYAAPGELIDSDSEESRWVELSDEEEARLLKACEGEGRRHLKALVVCAIESGCRQGELLGLKWEDVDFAQGVLYATSYKGRTMKRRPVYITSRMREVLLDLRRKPSFNAFRAEMDELSVFGVGEVKHSFNAARHEAKLDHLHFHDLRHVAATRLAESGMNSTFIGQILGHSNPRTTAKYINRTKQVLDEARSVMERRK